jgi:hypothetical protein
MFVYAIVRLSLVTKLSNIHIMVLKIKCKTIKANYRKKAKKKHFRPRLIWTILLVF